MAKKVHKPVKSSKQVYAERKAAEICVSCAKFKAAKDSVECQVWALLVSDLGRHCSLV